MRKAWNDPLVRGVWLMTVAVIVVIAAAFGLLLLGDAIGGWEFDSGLGHENGDPTPEQGHDPAQTRSNDGGTP